MSRVWFEDRKGLSCLFVGPEVLEEYLRGGEVRDSTAIRVDLQALYGGDMVCPVTVRRGLMAIGDRVFGELAEGAAIGEVAPIWRVVEPSSSLGKRFGREWVSRMRVQEVGGG